MPIPLLLGTWSFAERGIEAAIGDLLAGGDPLDACEVICSTAERDETVDSVGYGGLPDAAGVISLDAMVMRSPRENGSVCCLRHHIDATRVARLVMETTPHLMLVGHAGDALATAHGMPEEPMLAPAAREAWLRWRQEHKDVDQARDSSLRPHDQGPEVVGPLFSSERQSSSPAAGGETTGEERWTNHDTIGALVIDSNGVMAGACSTSGLAYKRPGRVGDSPIIGHGLYVEPGVGMAVGTGEGEFLMGICGAYAAVEGLRAGHSPIEAARRVLERVDEFFEPNEKHQVGMITCTADGTYASVALRDGFRAAVGDSDGIRVVEPDLVLHPGT